MYELRERLRQKAPNLHHTLERCWEIALNEWIPAMGIKNDSYNSYPHLRNLENYLTRVILQFEKQNPGQELLNPVEFYVLFSCILFHDIGRLGNSRICHSDESYRLITEQTADLGLHSPELARTIARICRLHDYDADKYKTEVKHLTTVSIDPYGEIRERVLSSLLVLIDHLDATHLRVLPFYLRTKKLDHIVGAFREVVRGTKIDLEGKCIHLVIGDGFDKRKTKDRQLRFKFRIKQSEKQLYRMHGKTLRFLRFCNKILCKRKNTHPFQEWNDEHINNRELLSSLKYENKVKLAPLLGGIQSDVLEAVPNRKMMAWPRGVLLAMIMKDTATNAAALAAISDTLSSVGIPLAGWLLEYREKLYDADGFETFEPLFEKRYLKHVFDGMYRLSTEVFPHGSFTYETLASEVRDPDISRIRRAVKRLSIICEEKLFYEEDGKQWRLEFWCSDTQWSLSKSEYSTSSEENKNAVFSRQSDAGEIIQHARSRLPKSESSKEGES